MRNLSIMLAALVALAVPAAAQTALQNPDARQQTSLDGEWKIIVDPLSTGDTTILGTPKEDGYFLDLKADGPADLLEYDFDAAPSVTVPGDWRAQISELDHYEGIAWYRKRFDHAPSGGKRYFLQFEAVNNEASVFLNGTLLGKHEGGFTPFAFEATEHLIEGENRLVVKVDAERRAERVPGIRMDWRNYAGIVRSVRLIETPQSLVRSYKVELAGNEGDAIAVSATLDGPARRVRIAIPELGLEWTGATDAQGNVATTLDPDCLTLWYPEAPKLYDVVIEVDGEVLTDQIGFRRIAAAGDRILLNGRPIYLRGISFHDEMIGENGGRITTSEQARAVLAKALELGANFVRLAHYPHNEAMVREADRMGLLVWSELPVYWGIDWTNPATLASALRQYDEMIARDYNRASIGFWSIANETANSPERLAFLKRLAENAREKGGNRLIAAALLPDYGDAAVAKLVQRVTAIAQGQPAEPYAIEIDDPLGEHIDVVALNQYYGWYYSRPIAQATGMPVADIRDAVFKLIPQLRFSNAFGKPMLISELGAGAVHGRRGEPGEIWTEDFQARYYRAQLGMLLANPGLSGVSPWVLKDFRSPMRPLAGVQDGWNRKGLISPTGERKLAFDVLKFLYRAYGTYADQLLPPIPTCPVAPEEVLP